MELLSELPIELQHKVFYFVAEHPVAKIIKDFSTMELDLEINEQDMCGSCTGTYKHVGYGYGMDIQL